MMDSSNGYKTMIIKVTFLELGRGIMIITTPYSFKKGVAERDVPERHLSVGDRR